MISGSRLRYSASIGTSDASQCSRHGTSAIVRRLASRPVPRLRHAQIIRTWTGIEGVMPDDIPVIGPSRTTPGLVHAFGFSGHGFQLGPAMGAVLGELILDGATPTPIAAFDIGRFASRKR